MTTIALFQRGFRPFFLGAALHAIVAMVLWMLVYAGDYALPLPHITPSLWHAHEMVHGYALAVIAGFLLTAVQNWTGRETASGATLAVLFLLWLVARVLWCSARHVLPLAAACDLLFGVLLIVACARPIIAARQWKQMAVLSKLVLLVVGNAFFYAGAFGLLEQGARWGVHGSFWLVIALILTMGRRLIPFFMERGIEPAPALRNSLALDLCSLFLLLGFWFVEVFVPRPTVAACLSAALFVVNAARLRLWYVPALWRHPLLWSLYLSFALMALGFLLRALQALLPISPFIPLHLFAIGGIGLVTLSMMARVALGHTGRDVHRPPRVILAPFALALVALLARVALPLVAPGLYGTSVLLAQLAWIAAFGVFLTAWLPMLVAPRVDGAPG